MHFFFFFSSCAIQVDGLKCLETRLQKGTQFKVLPALKQHSDGKTKGSFQQLYLRSCRFVSDLYFNSRRAILNVNFPGPINVLKGVRFTLF